MGERRDRDVRIKPRPKERTKEEEAIHEAQSKYKTSEAQKVGDRLDIVRLQHLSIIELHEIAKDMRIDNYKQLRKNDLVFKILQARTEKDGLIFARGILEVLPDGFGFLRTNNYLPSSEDIYVSQTQIKRFNITTGDSVSGQVRPPKDGERYFSLLKVEAVNGRDPEDVRERTLFSNLTPMYP